MAEIPSTPVDGNLLVLVAKAVANKNAPKITEFTTPAAFDASCYLTDWDESGEESTIEDSRICDREDREKPGRKKRGLNLTYVDNTNTPYATDSNKAVETLGEGEEYFILERRGMPYETPLAADQVVSIWPVQGGMQTKVKPEGNTTFRRTQKQFITSPVAVDVKLVA